MSAGDIGAYVGLSLGLFLAVSVLGCTMWVSCGGMEDLHRRRTNRRGPAPRGWGHFIGLDGAVELGHANGTITATARDAAHNSTHATADDTATGAASGNANGAASEPR